MKVKLRILNWFSKIHILCISSSVLKRLNVFKHLQDTTSPVPSNSTFKSTMTWTTGKTSQTNGEVLPGRASGSSTLIACSRSSGLSRNLCRASRTTRWSWFSTNSNRWLSLTEDTERMIQALQRNYILQTSLREQR